MILKDTEINDTEYHGHNEEQEMALHVVRTMQMAKEMFDLVVMGIRLLRKK